MSKFSTELYAADPINIEKYVCLFQLTFAFNKALAIGLWQHIALQWRHNERDGVSNHQPHDYILNPVLKAKIKENVKDPWYWLLWGKFTGDQWLPRIKGQ